MRIGVFHPPIHLRYFGGSVAVTVPIVNELVENGYEVFLFVKDHINQKMIEEMVGEKILPFVKIILKPSLFEPRSFIDLYECALKVLILKMKCDVIIDTYSNYIFPWTDVCYIHFPYINNYNFNKRFPYLKGKRGLLNSILNLPYIFYAKNIQHYHSKLILANSHFTAEAISQSINADARVLYPPISISFFENDNNISASKQRENLVVSIGRLTEDKKIEIIPHIASLIKEKRVKFLIIGFAHSNKAIEKINKNINTLNLKDKVRILTNVPRSKVKKILQRAKVYLHPPTIEHFGISIAEAMASGCIPVVYNIGGVREFVPKKFRYKNLYEAAEKVERALNYWSPKEARRMNLIAQKFAEPNFRKNFYKMFSEYLSRRKTEEMLSQRFINVRRKKEILNGF